MKQNEIYIWSEICFSDVNLCRLRCQRCGYWFLPKINSKTGELSLHDKCPNRHCRSPTWNVDEESLKIRKQKRAENRKHRIIKVKPTKSMFWIKPMEKKKAEKKIMKFACFVCENMFEDKNALERHQERRNHY